MSEWSVDRIDELTRQVRGLQAENLRLRDTARNYEIAMHGARGERDSALAEVERLWVNLDDARAAVRRQVRSIERYEASPRRQDEIEAERDAAREQVRQRDEVIERVRELVNDRSRHRFVTERRNGYEVTHYGEGLVRIDDLRAALEGDGR